MLEDQAQVLQLRWAQTIVRWSPTSLRDMGTQVGGDWRQLIEEHGAVEGVALDGLEAGVADDAAEFFFGGAVAGAGGFDDVFFEHDGAYVVAAEMEAKLEDLE